MFTPSSDISPIHLALKVEERIFSRAIGMLKSRNARFGNDPEHPDNGEVKDPLGGGGRVYFYSRDGHLFELCF